MQSLHAMTARCMAAVCVVAFAALPLAAQSSAVTCATTTKCEIRVSRARGLSQANADCPPLFFLDGVRSDIDLLASGSIPIQDIGGVEVYRSNGESPAEYAVAGSGCGVVAVWTRTGHTGAR